MIMTMMIVVEWYRFGFVINYILYSIMKLGSCIEVENENQCRGAHLNACRV